MIQDNEQIKRTKEQIHNSIFLTRLKTKSRAINVNTLHERFVSLYEFVNLTKAFDSIHQTVKFPTFGVSLKIK